MSTWQDLRIALRHHVAAILGVDETSVVWGADVHADPLVRLKIKPAGTEHEWRVGTLDASNRLVEAPHHQSLFALEARIETINAFVGDEYSEDALHYAEQLRYGLQTTARHQALEDDGLALVDFPRIFDTSFSFDARDVTSYTVEARFRTILAVQLNEPVDTIADVQGTGSVATVPIPEE